MKRDKQLVFYTNNEIYTKILEIKSETDVPISLILHSMIKKVLEERENNV